MANINENIAFLVDKWCERRSLLLLRYILPFWPIWREPEFLNDQWRRVWAGFRHIRTYHRDELLRYGEYEKVNEILTYLCQVVPTPQLPEDIDKIADRIIKTIWPQSDEKPSTEKF